MLYKVVNIADKKLFDSIANILIYVYVWVLFFFDHTDAAVDEPFVSPAKSNRSRAQKNLGQMSPVLEPFGVVPHVLYIFHSLQLPPALLKRKYTAFFA